MHSFNPFLVMPASFLPIFLQAVVPIPQPIGHEPFTLAQITKNYKMQLSFDGDRVATHWFQLMGKGAPEVPYLLVSLVRSGDALVSASAEVVALPPSDVHYERVRAEFSDHNLWPKHLPVYYHWEARHDVDVGRGLMVLFAAGAAAMLLAVLSVVRSYKRQLQQFLDDVTGETPLRAVGGFSGSMVKAD